LTPNAAVELTHASEEPWDARHSICTGTTERTICASAIPPGVYALRRQNDGYGTLASAGGAAQNDAGGDNGLGPVISPNAG
jgi:hypothetical protein